MNLQTLSEIHGLNFFNNAPACLSHYEKLPWSKKALSQIQSFGTLFTYVLYKIRFSFSQADNRQDPTHENVFSKKRLIVCIHGLNNNPAQFNKIKSEIQKKDLSETDIFIPSVIEQGNAKLDEMIKPILEEIARWKQTSPKKELILVGISNGGRIARAIEAEIAKSEDFSNINKLHFISIVGACKGSSLVNLTNKLGFSWLMSKNISEEMPTNSKRNQQLNEDWANSLSTGPVREYTFIASPHDWQVTNYSSSLMEVHEKNARYALVMGHGHNSIVNGIAKPVAELILP